MCIKIYKQVLANYKSVKTNGHKLEKPIEMKNPSVQLDKRLYSGLTREFIQEFLSNGDGNKRSLVKFILYPKFGHVLEISVCATLEVRTRHRWNFYAMRSVDTLTTPIRIVYMVLTSECAALRRFPTELHTPGKEYLAQRRKIIQEEYIKSTRSPRILARNGSLKKPFAEGSATSPRRCPSCK